MKKVLVLLLMILPIENAALACALCAAKQGGALDGFVLDPEVRDRVEKDRARAANEKAGLSEMKLTLAESACDPDAWKREARSLNGVVSVESVSGLEVRVQYRSGDLTERDVVEKLNHRSGCIISSS